MDKLGLSPILKAYSRSLLRFIGFIKERYPFPPGEGSFLPFEDPEEEENK